MRFNKRARESHQEWERHKHSRIINDVSFFLDGAWWQMKLKFINTILKHDFYAQHFIDGICAWSPLIEIRKWNYDVKAIKLNYDWKDE